MKKGRMQRISLFAMMIILVSGCNPKSLKEMIRDWRGQLTPPPAAAVVEQYIPTTFSVAITQVGQPKPMSNIAGAYITDDYGKVVVEYQMSGQTGEPIRIYAIKFGSDTFAKSYWNKFRDLIQGDPEKEKYRGYTTKNAWLYFEHKSKNYAMSARLIGFAVFAIEVPRSYPDYERLTMSLDSDMIAHFKALQAKASGEGATTGS